MSNARILVAGGGAVGLAFAAACEGCEVDVFEAASARVDPLPETIDLRVFALSSGTRAFLKDIGAWDALDAARIAAVRKMEVFGDEGSRISFAPRPGESLAWIVEGNRLLAALEEAAASPTIRIHRGTPPARLSAAADQARLELADGAVFEAGLLVGADGPDSQVRSTFGIGSEEEPYDESAVVAHFDCEEPHDGIARQWFRHDGVLAWLPLPGRRVSIVWSAPQRVAEELCSLSPSDLSTRVVEAGGAALGGMTLFSTVAKFPLRLIRVDDPVKPGVALIGDAAHAVHPLAGQGMNLGLQDARCLAHVLAERTPLERPGDLRVLRRYARARREDVSAMQFVTDGLDHLFAARGPGIAALRNFGLRLVDRQEWAKRALAARAMR